MDVFALRNQLVGDYRRVVERFLTVRAERIGERVGTELSGGLLWPDPPPAHPSVAHLPRPES